MLTFLWTVFAWECLGVIFQAVYLGRPDYPRTEEIGAGQDVFRLFIYLAFMVWSGYLITQY